MIYLSAAAVVIALLALIGFRMWLTTARLASNVVLHRLDVVLHRLDDLDKLVGELSKTHANLAELVAKLSTQHLEAERRRLELKEQLKSRLEEIEAKAVPASVFAALETELHRCQQNIRDLAAMPVPVGGDVTALTERVDDLEKALGNFWVKIGEQFPSREEFEKTVAKLSEVKSNGFATGNRRFVTRAM